MMQTPHELPVEIQLTKNRRSIFIVGGLGRGFDLYQRLDKHIGAFKKDDIKGLEFEVQFLDLSDHFLWEKDLWHGPCPELSAALEHKILSRSFSVMTKFGPVELANADQVKVVSKEFPFLMDYLGNWAKTIEYGSRQFLDSDSEKERFQSYWKGSVVEPAIKITGDLDTSPLSEKQKRKVEDVAFDGKDKAAGLVLGGERSDYVTFDQLVWSFSGRETEFLSKNLAEKIFRHRSPAPIYSWVAYHVEFSGVPNLPPDFLWVEEPALHWSRSNALSFRKVSPRKNQSKASTWYQVWLRLPEVFRFSNSDLLEEKRQIEKLLQKNPVTDAGSFTIHLPKESTLDSSSLGPSLFGKRDQSSSQDKLAAKNIHQLHWDLVPTFLWADLREHEALVERRLLKWCADEIQTHLKMMAKLETKSK